MPSLSAALIVKNEASNLGRCLASIRDLVDEIVVVDTGSTDGTVAIAEGFGARIFQFPWTNDFAAARNESLRHCTGDWVLILDADEAIDALDFPVLRAACAKPGADAYRLILRNYYSGGGRTVQGEPPRLNDGRYTQGAGYSHYADGHAVRLCRRLEGLHFTGRIHELLDPFFLARHRSIQSLNAVIHHFGKADEAREAQKKAFYLELAVQDATVNPSNAQFQFNVLQQAMTANAWDIALDAATAYLRLERHPNSLGLLGAGMALQFAGRHGEALGPLKTLLAREPAHAQALTRMAVSCAALGQPDEARRCLARAMAAQPAFIVPYVNLAELESQLGNPVAAREALEKGLRVCPGDAQLLHARVQLSLALGSLEQAVADAGQAIVRCPGGGQGVWHRLVAYQALVDGRKAEALALLDQGLSAFPGNADLERLRQMASA
jgi:tetratricopeptide (TPR) repeat protein